ncbi:MAG: OpgC domain-containing protein [Opitutaceae bacterium]|nr:OpgC domain-containing protein [Opitutaceae bacterium]
MPVGIRHPPLRRPGPAVHRHPATPRPQPASAGRDLRLDTLRGWMLVAMAVNHLNTELRVFTDHAFGFVSTAEGFVFLSGLVAGLVYTRRAVGNPAAAWQDRARRRAREIYLWHLGGFMTTFLGLQLLALLTGRISTTSPALFFQHPVAAVPMGALLLYQPGLFDILPMYCVFMLLLPTVLAGLQARRWGWIFAVSGGLWLLAQAGLRDYLQAGLARFLPVNLGVFDLLAWQLLFVLGACFGYHWAKPSRPLLSFRPAMLLLCLVVAVPLWFLLKYQHLPWPGVTMDMVWAWADKAHLAPLRLLNFIVVAYLIAAVAVRRPGFFAFRPLAFLGRHSLAVFTVQAVVCALVLTQPDLFATFASRTLTALGLVAVLFATAGMHQQLSTWRRSDDPTGSADRRVWPEPESCN